MSQDQVEALANDLPGLQISSDQNCESSPSVSPPSNEDAVAAVEVKAQTVNPFDLFKAEGNGYVKAGKHSEALEQYELAWNVCQTDDERAMILNNRGVVYEKMGDINKALEMFQEALTIKPEYVKVLLRRGLVHKNLKNYDLAIEDLSDAQVLAVKNNQNLIGLTENIGQLIIECAELEIEKICASRAFEFPKSSYIETYFRGFYCDPVCRMYKGLDPCPSDNRQDGDGDAPENFTGFLAAMACMKSKEYSAVPDHCTTEINNPEASYRVEALLLRGSFNFLCGDCAGALADFQAVADDPNASKELKSSAHLKAGLCQNLWGSCEETAAHYAKAEEFWKQNGDVYYHAAVCLVDKGEIVPALALLEKGAEECPEPKQCPLLHVLRLSIQTSYNACVYSGGTAVKDTLDQLQEMERNGAFDIAECYEMYGQALLLVNETGEQMLEMFDKAVELAGGDKFFQLKKVMAAIFKTDDREEALKMLEKFTDDPDTASVAYYHIGEINMMMQRFDEGFEAIDKAIELSKSIYDIKLRVMGKMDFKYNVRVAQKMKLHNISLFPQPDEATKALE